MNKTTTPVILFLLSSLSCSSPARIEVRPNPLVLEGKDAKGQLTTVVFDENGKELEGSFPVTWLPLDEKTAKVAQDGSVKAVSSGKVLVDVEIVGTEIHGVGNIEVKIPSFIELSDEALRLVQGQQKITVWAEVRDDNRFPMQGYAPGWKVDNPSVVGIEAMQDATLARSYLTITPGTPGETYITASHKDLAADIAVTVLSPEDAAASAEE